MLGGSVRATSVVGEGTRFEFTIDCEVGEIESKGLGNETQVDLEGLSVLVVDDNATNRLILDELLSSWGMVPTSVAGGVEALREINDASVRCEPFSLILLDAQMPGMDGLELAEQISKLKQSERCDAEVMMLSSCLLYTSPSPRDS